MVPPRRTASIAVLRAASRSMPATCMPFSMIASGTTAVAFCASVASGEPCASMPTASITASGPRPSVRSRTWATTSACVGAAGGLRGRRDDLDLVAACPCQPCGDDVRGDDPARAQMLGHPCGHVTDRAQSEHQHTAALGDARVLPRLPGRRQHVGQIDVAVVERGVWNLDREGVAEGHPEVLGLAARDLPVELGVAEERGPEALLPVLRGLALGLQALRAHPARAAGDVERDDDPVAGFHRRHVGPDLADDPHRLVAPDVADGHERGPDLDEMEVGAADAGGGDLHDDICRLLDDRVRNGLDADVTASVPGHCAHVGISLDLAVIRLRRRRSWPFVTRIALLSTKNGVAITLRKKNRY